MGDLDMVEGIVVEVEGNSDKVASETSVTTTNEPDMKAMTSPPIFLATAGAISGWVIGSLSQKLIISFTSSLITTFIFLFYGKIVNGW